MEQTEIKTPKRQIIIAGKNGAGKSTVNKLLCEALPEYDSYSAGDFMRNIAVDRGISLEKLHDLAKKNPKIDEDIDDQTRAIKDQEDFILDSRIGFHFLPEAFTVFVDCPEEISAQRIVNNAHQETGRAGQTVGSLEEEITKLKKRQQDNLERYQEYYQIENYIDPKHFNLVVDTSVIGPEEVRDQILEAYREHLGE